MTKYQNDIFQFKIFGERHTATNAIAKLLLQNFDLDFPYYDFLGWKHRKAPAEKELRGKPLVPRTLFVITVRHPYDWAAAMHRWPYCDYDGVIHMHNFLRFLRYPIEDYANILEMWNQKYASYRKLIELVPFATVIRYEDFKKDQLAILESLYEWLPKPENPQPMNQYMHGGVGWNMQLTERRIDGMSFRHWLQHPITGKDSAPPKKPLAEVTEEIKAFIDQEIDHSLVSYFYPDFN